MVKSSFAVVLGDVVKGKCSPHVFGFCTLTAPKIKNNKKVKLVHYEVETRKAVCLGMRNSATVELTRIGGNTSGLGTKSP